MYSNADDHIGIYTRGWTPDVVCCLERWVEGRPLSSIRLGRHQCKMAATAPASTIPPILQGHAVDFYELQDKKIEEVEHLEDNSNGISHDLPQSKFATIGQAAALRLFWKGKSRYLAGHRRDRRKS